MDERYFIDGFSSLYIVDIELRLEETSTSSSSFGKEDGEIVAAEVFLGYTFQSPLELYCELGLTN